MNDDELFQMFKKLLQEWERDTAFHSSYNVIQNHPNNQKIVDLGNRVIPLLLEETRKSPDMKCHMSLKILTNVKLDVPKEHIGKTKEIARLWVNWGKEAGYIK
jgi:hypothetical protein